MTTTQSALRNNIELRRKALDEKQQKKASSALLARFKTNRHVQQAKHIGLYFSTRSEIATKDLIHYCWQTEKQVYLPVLHPFSKGHLLFFNYKESDRLVTNQFGILEPVLNIHSLILPNELDIICAPLVAFDSQGNRVGMGGGYYDRFFSYATKAIKIGLAHDCQWVKKIEANSWDVPLNEVLTPSKHWIFGTQI